MADPKYAFEAALYTLLNAAAGVTWPVYGRTALGRWQWDYILVEPQPEAESPEKLRVYEYEYQIAAISLSAANALQQAALVDTALETMPTVTGYYLPWVDKVAGVDYAEVLEGGQHLWHVGAVYRFRLRKKT